MNRRTALAALMALPAVASGMSTNVDTEDEWIPKTPRKFARWVAEWDLRAIKFNHARTWQRAGYVSCFRWNDDWAAFVGIGPPDWLTDRAARVLAMFCHENGGEIVSDFEFSAYRTPCGHAWCLVVEGVLSEGFRAEFKRPLWRLGPVLEGV